MPKMYKQMPLRYLWPIAIILSFVTALWVQFPWNLSLEPLQTDTQPLRPSPKVAYITIDEASINQLVKRAASEWMLGSGSKEKRRSIGLDLTTLEASLEAPPPTFLDKGSIIPTVWKPEEIANLKIETPSISLPEIKPIKTSKKTPFQRDAINVRLSSSLLAAKFQFQFSGDALKNTTSPSGQCRFYLECNEAGEVDHVLRLSPVTTDTSVFERALMLGKAKTSASGWVDIEWTVRK